MVKIPTTPASRREFWASCDAVCSAGRTGRSGGFANCGKGEPDAGRARRARRRARPLPRRSGGGGAMMHHTESGARARPPRRRAHRAPTRPRRSSSPSPGAHPLREQPHPPERRRGERARHVRAVIGTADRRREHEPHATTRRSRPAATPRSRRPASRRRTATFPGCPSPSRCSTVERASAATRAFDAERRARPRSARSSSESAERGLTAAGKVRTAEHTVAVANSPRRRRRHAGDERAGDRALDGPDDRQRLGVVPRPRRERARAAALGAEAAELALRSADPTDLEPGVYPVVLAPEAVADIMDFLA